MKFIYTSITSSSSENSYRFRTTAIILNYYHHYLTSKCVKSITGQVDTIIIVDNSANDDAFRALITEMKTKFHQEDATAIKVLRPPSNLGFGKGINFAVNFLESLSTNCKYLLVINNDCIVLPDTIKKLIAALDDYNGNAMVAPNKTTNNAHSLLWYNRVTGILSQKNCPGHFHISQGRAF